jgi:hypothetical protein
VESNWVHSALRPPMAYCASPRRLWRWRNWWNDLQGKPKYSEKTYPSATLSTTNPTCCPDSNPGRRGGKPAFNRLSCGTARCANNKCPLLWNSRVGSNSDGFNELVGTSMGPSISEGPGWNRVTVDAQLCVVSLVHVCFVLRVESDITLR